MRFLKFNGVLKEITELHTNIDKIEFLQEELKLPDYKAEELASRIEKEFIKEVTDERENVKSILENTSKSEVSPQDSGYSVESLSKKEFKNFIIWLLEELGYTIHPEKYDAAFGVNLIATKGGEKIAIQCIKCPQPYKISNSILLVSETFERTLGCQRSIILATTFFDKQTILDAQKFGVELWDPEALSRKINEVRKKAELEVKSQFPQYEGSLLQSLLRLGDMEQFILEPKGNGKYDLHLSGVKYPLLTFQAQVDSIVRCICRIKNNKPVGENEGTSLISVDRNNRRVDLGEKEAYALVVRYLEDFLE
jgi:hypothetical protein